MKSLAKSNFLCFLMLVALSLILVALTNHFVLTISFYRQSGSPLSWLPVEEAGIYESMKKWVYISTVIYLLVKISVVSLLIHTTLFLHGDSVPWNRTFYVALISEYIFLLPAFIKLIFFHFYYPEGTLADWHRIYILSALSIFESAPQDWYYALQTLNVFEIIYWFLLAYGISVISGHQFDKSLKLIISSYLPALLIWIALVSFVSITLFPGTA